MPTEVEHPVAAHILMHSRDTPSNFDDNFTSKTVRFKISESSKDI